MTRFLYGSKIFGSNIPIVEPEMGTIIPNYEMYLNSEIANLDFVNDPTKSTGLAHTVNEPKDVSFNRLYRSMHPEVYLYYSDTHQISSNV